MGGFGTEEGLLSNCDVMEVKSLLTDLEECRCDVGCSGLDVGLGGKILDFDLPFKAGMFLFGDLSCL